VQKIKQRLTVSLLGVGTAFALTACGAASSSHVVGAKLGSDTVPASTTAVAGAGAPPTTAPQITVPPTSAAESQGSQTVGSAAPAINQAEINQINTDLANLNSSLSQANNDLTNPQGDS
jgi:hypothetical protein